MDATLGDGCRNWEHLHSLKVVKCLEGYCKTLWIYIQNLKKTVISRCSLGVITVGSQPTNQWKWQFSSLFLWRFCSKPRGITFCFFKYFSCLRIVLLPQSRMESHYFVLSFTQRNEDVGWEQCFIFLFLILINGVSGRIREWDKVKIPFSKPRGGKMFLNSSASGKKSRGRGRVVLQI